MIHFNVYFSVGLFLMLDSLFLLKCIVEVCVSVSEEIQKWTICITIYSVIFHQ